MLNLDEHFLNLDYFSSVSCWCIFLRWITSCCLINDVSFYEKGVRSPHCSDYSPWWISCNMFQCVQRGCWLTADLEVPLSKMLSIKIFEKEISMHISVCSILYVLYFCLSRLLCLFPARREVAPLGAASCPDHKLCPGARWTSQALWARRRETGGSQPASQPASYLTHTFAEHFSRWASLKPWGRPEGIMQRWHLHHRQQLMHSSHFTLVLLGLPLFNTVCVCFFGLVWCKMPLGSIKYTSSSNHFFLFHTIVSLGHSDIHCIPFEHLIWCLCRALLRWRDYIS